MCMQVYDSANKISTIFMQCHSAAITQMVMDGLHCPLGDATQSEHSQKLRWVVYNYTLCVVISVVWTISCIDPCSFVY